MPREGARARPAASDENPPCPSAAPSSVAVREPLVRPWTRFPGAGEVRVLRQAEGDIVHTPFSADVAPLPTGELVG